MTSNDEEFEETIIEPISNNIMYKYTIRKVYIHITLGCDTEKFNTDEDGYFRENGFHNPFDVKKVSVMINNDEEFEEVLNFYKRIYQIEKNGK